MPHVCLSMTVWLLFIPDSLTAPGPGPRRDARGEAEVGGGAPGPSPAPVRAAVVRPTVDREPERLQSGGARQAGGTVLTQ